MAKKFIYTNPVEEIVTSMFLTPKTAGWFQLFGAPAFSNVTGEPAP